MDPLTALLVLTFLGIVLRQHAVVQAHRVRAPYSPSSSVHVPAPTRRDDAAARAGVPAAAAQEPPTVTTETTVAAVKMPATCP